MKNVFIAILLIILFIGCKKEIPEYESSANIPKPVERIGPQIEKSLQPKQYTLEMPQEKIYPSARSTFELTEHDLFVEKQWDPARVSVFNLTLGDSLDMVLSVLGRPDEVTPHPSLDIVNLGYGSSLHLGNLGVIFYVANKTVMRITVKEEFNPYLHGQTVINYTKKDIYDKWGVPDEQQDFSNFRVFRYTKQGLEILHTRNRMKGFVITYPKEKTA